ncbi:MAG: methyltransferase domain-containing protein [Hyphomicrobiaceae bacterium]|nr:methyltransferase domain-containing protein [Hyphomicrobiaceae bacterium]
MTASSRRPPARQDWEALAARAVHTGDLKGARAAYIEALRHDRRNAQVHFNQAAVLAALGEIDESAVHLTEALRLKPQHEEAAIRLSRLLARFAVDASRLDPFGLKAALGIAAIDSQPAADAAFRLLAAASPELAGALQAARAGQAEDTAHRLLASRTSEVLKSDLLLAALAAGVVMDAGLERLLTALRRTLLLEVAPERFEDRALYAFALGLLVQGWNNDQAWAVSDEEARALDRIAIDKSALLAGDLEMARRLLLLGLYRPLDGILAPAEANSWSHIRPKPLRDLVGPRLERQREEERAAAAIPRLAPVADDTSRRVARQYEASPYPRWQSLHVSAAGAMKAVLSRFVEPARLVFMDGRFDVLIAGAGTGKQALQSAFAYGPDARLLAVDLSAASLGYAQCAATRYGVGNVELMVADILDLGRLERRFDIIECVGVLHHMADPWNGWRKLLACLKPGGLMYVGLYSAVSRANLRALREDPDYPGPDCDDDAARAYRARILGRPAGSPAAELTASRDFYTLHEFRDLALHASEQHVTLDEIGRFLDENGLAFRGFTLDPVILNAFMAEHPGSQWPGSLAEWQEFERARPSTFDAMYRFWCERLPPG